MVRGPRGGQAWRYLRSLARPRADDPEEATAELLSWWNARARNPSDRFVDYCLGAGDGTASIWTGQPDLDIDGDGDFEGLRMDFDGDGLFDDALVDAGWRRARGPPRPRPR